MLRGSIIIFDFHGCVNHRQSIYFPNGSTWFPFSADAPFSIPGKCWRESSIVSFFLERGTSAEEASRFTDPGTWSFKLVQWPAGDDRFVIMKPVWARPTLSSCNGLLSNCKASYLASELWPPLSRYKGDNYISLVVVLSVTKQRKLEWVACPARWSGHYPGRMSCPNEAR